MSDYDFLNELDKKVDIDGFNKDVKEASKGGFEELPLGKYEVRLESLEMKATKKAKDPMIVAQFTVIEGDYKKRKVFVNQVCYMASHPNSNANRMNISLQFLRSLDSGLEVEFEGFKALARLVERIDDKCEGEEYLLEIGENKGFRNYKIVEHFDSMM